MKANQFPLLLHAFFHDWLVQQRNVSHHTVLSYRDSWRLFLRFVAAQKTKSVARVAMVDLTAVEPKESGEEDTNTCGNDQDRADPCRTMAPDRAPKPDPENEQKQAGQV